MLDTRAPLNLSAERDFERYRRDAQRRFVARARRTGQAGFFDVHDLADEYYQDAWAELSRRSGHVVTSDIPGYLAAVMWYRFCRMELRRRRPSAVSIEDGELARVTAPADASTPDALAAHKDELGRLVEAVDELPERERVALMMRGQGLGHRDIAAALQVSVLRARKLCHAAHQSLALAVGPDADEGRCRRFESILRALHYGWPVGAERRRRLDRHLKRCGSCRASIAVLRERSFAADVPVVAVPAVGLLGWLRSLASRVLGSRIVARLASSRRSGAGGGSGASGGAIGSSALGKLAACCLLCGAVGVGIGLWPRGGGAMRREGPALQAALPGSTSAPVRARAAALTFAQKPDRVYVAARGHGRRGQAMRQPRSRVRDARTSAVHRSGALAGDSERPARTPHIVASAARPSPPPARRSARNGDSGGGATSLTMTDGGAGLQITVSGRSTHIVMRAPSGFWSITAPGSGG